MHGLDHALDRLGRHLDARGVLVDADAGDLLRRQVRLVGDRAHEILRAHAGVRAQAQSERGHARARTARALAAVGPGPALGPITTLRPITTLGPRAAIRACGAPIRAALEVDRVALVRRKQLLLQQRHRGGRDDVHGRAFRGPVREDQEVGVGRLHGGLHPGGHGLRALRVQLRARGHLQHRHLLLDLPLDVAEQPHLARVEEREGHAFLARAAGAADAVHVDLGRGGQIEVHHVAERLDVQAARGDVGGHQHAHRAFLEALEHAVTLLLGEAAVQRGGRVARAHQHVRELFHLVAGAAEDERALRALPLEHAHQRRFLVLALHHVGRLADGGQRAGVLRAGDDAHAHRVLQVLLGDLRDARGQRGREQRGLPLGGQLVQDGLEVVLEAHVEHLVGLVEHHELHLREQQRLAADVVERAPGGRHHHVDAALERPHLVEDLLAAVDRERGDAHAGAVLLHCFGDLHRELARGHQHQRLGLEGPAVLRRHQLEHGQREGRRLAGTRRRLAEHVTPGDQRGNGLALNRRGLLVAEPLQGGEHFGTEPEGLEGDGRGSGGLHAEPRTRLGACGKALNLTARSGKASE